MAAVFAIAGGAASAATTTGTIGVSGTVVGGCTMAATPMSFGTAIASPVTANVDTQSTLTVRCTNGTVFYVAMNAGSGTGATVAQRKISGPGGSINYLLHMNPTRTVLWGDGTLGTFIGTATSTGAAANYGIYGRIPPGQAPNPGTYTDVVTITLTF